MTNTERRLRTSMQREAAAQRVLAELSAQQELLDADLRNAERLAATLQDLDESRTRTRLAYERAKLAREAADGAIERLKYTALLSHFPTMDDTTRLILSRIMADGRCIACNAPAQERQAQLEEQVSQGLCPICGSQPEAQDNLVARHEFDQARLTRELDRAAQARREETAQSQQLSAVNISYREALSQWENLQETIHRRRERDRRLRAQLPDSARTRQYRTELDSLRADHNHWQAQRAVRLQELRDLLADRRDVITARSTELATTFARLVEAPTRRGGPSGSHRTPTALPRGARSERRPYRSTRLRSRDVIARPPRPLPARRSKQSLRVAARAHRPRVPTSAGRRLRRRRHLRHGDPGRPVSTASPCERVGNALAAFASGGGNRLVVTTNLTNAGVITALFQATEPDATPAARMQRVLNLLQVALPNRCIAPREGPLPGAAQGRGRHTCHMTFATDPAPLPGDDLDRLKQRCRVLLLLEAGRTGRHCPRALGPHPRVRIPGRRPQPGLGPRPVRRQGL